MDEVRHQVKGIVDMWTSLYPPQTRRDGRTPTDLDAICADKKIKVQEDDLELEHAGFILYNPHTLEMEIWLRKDDAYLRQRFTVAHELGHFVFDPHIPISNRDSRVKAGTKPEEDRANLFAANLLIPDRRLKPFIVKFSNEQREKKVEEVIRAVAHRFMVHEKAAAIHLKNEGYISFEAWQRWAADQKGRT